MNIIPVCSVCGENIDMELDTLGNWICTTCVLDATWMQSDDSYFSYHLTIVYLGDKVPKYHVLQNPDGDGWVIGVFYPLIGGEYIPLEEDGEERLVFSTAEEAMNHVDGLLK